MLPQMLKQVAQQFANALDANVFDKAIALLDVNCIYNIKGKEIIDFYRKADAWCKKTLDAYKYESSVDEEGVITFYDHITHSGLKHTHCCKQRITLNNDGLITRIEHIELPNQREAIDKFFEQVSISRDS
jgi:hypothetical protein